MSLFDLTGKVAVVTGSTKGIGRAIAERMAEHGAKVVISSRKGDVCETVAKGIRDKGGEAVAIPCHVAHKEQIAGAGGRHHRALGRHRHHGGKCGRSIRISVPPRGCPTTPTTASWMPTCAAISGCATWCARTWPSVAAAPSSSFPRSAACAARASSASMRFPRRRTCSWCATSRWSGGRRTSAPTASRQDWCAPISPVRCGRTRCCTASARGIHRCSASANPMRSPVRRCSLPSAAGSFITGQTIVIDGGTTAGVAADGRLGRVPTRADCAALDAADTLAAFRDEFHLPAGVIYLDGNSLGPLPKATAAEVARTVTQGMGRGADPQLERCRLDRPAFRGRRPHRPADRRIAGQRGGGRTQPRSICSSSLRRR